MFQIILIRHADPDYQNDTITELGHTQAKSLAEALKNVSIDKIYCSPLGRAQATMQYTASCKGMISTTLDWLRELDGCYKVNEAGENIFAWKLHGVDTYAHGGITLENWVNRVPYSAKILPVAKAQYRAFDDFLTSHGIPRNGMRYEISRKIPDETIAFFCHEAFIKTLLAYLLQIPLPIIYSQMTIHPSSRTTLTLDEKDGYGVFRLISLNDCSHYNH